MLKHTQKEAGRYIQEVLAQRGVEVEPGIVQVGADQPWLLIEKGSRFIGIDPSSGLWIADSSSRWSCVAMPCSVSGALKAIEFLITG